MKNSEKKKWVKRGRKDAIEYSKYSHIMFMPNIAIKGTKLKYFNIGYKQGLVQLMLEGNSNDNK